MAEKMIDQLLCEAEDSSIVAEYDPSWLDAILPQTVEEFPIPEETGDTLGSLLAYACDVGCLDNVKSLLRQGADPNTASYNGKSALELAVLKQHTEIVKYLFEHRSQAKENTTTLLNSTRATAEITPLTHTLGPNLCDTQWKIPSRKTSPSPISQISTNSNNLRQSYEKPDSIRNVSTRSTQEISNQRSLYHYERRPSDPREKSHTRDSSGQNKQVRLGFDPSNEHDDRNPVLQSSSASYTDRQNSKRTSPLALIVRVGNIASNVNDNQLLEVFNTCGPIERIKRNNGSSRAEIEFTYITGIVRAIKLNGIKFFERRVHVQYGEFLHPKIVREVKDILSFDEKIVSRARRATKRHRSPSPKARKHERQVSRSRSRSRCRDRSRSRCRSRSRRITREDCRSRDRYRDKGDSYRSTRSRDEGNNYRESFYADKSYYRDHTRSSSVYRKGERAVPEEKYSVRNRSRSYYRETEPSQPRSILRPTKSSDVYSNRYGTMGTNSRSTAALRSQSSNFVDLSLSSPEREEASSVSQLRRQNSSRNHNSQSRYNPPTNELYQDHQSSRKSRNMNRGRSVPASTHGRFQGSQQSSSIHHGTSNEMQNQPRIQEKRKSNPSFGQEDTIGSSYSNGSHQEKSSSRFQLTSSLPRDRKRSRSTPGNAISASSRNAPGESSKERNVQNSIKTSGTQKEGGEKSTKFTVIASNVSKRAVDSALERMFSICGPVQDFQRSVVDKIPQPLVYVSFGNEISRQKALDLDGLELCGRAISVKCWNS